MLLGHLGDVLGPLRVLLDCSWGPLGGCSGALGIIFENLYGEQGALGWSWVLKRQNQ